MPKEMGNRSIRVEHSARAATSLGPPSRRGSTPLEETDGNDDSPGDGSTIRPPGSIKLISDNDPNAQETDPKAVNQPISHLIHAKLEGAWEINDELPMCFVFDASSPARIFKRGMKYSDESSFPTLTREDLEAGNVTETDGPSPGLMPYAPVLRSRKHFFKCSISANTFMAWTEGELRTIKHGIRRKPKGTDAPLTRYKEYQIPAPYERIISQLVAEDSHGDKHDSHESRRRRAYAREVLHWFGEELLQFNGTLTPPSYFFSKVLTPILQRQRVGIDDGYKPFVCAGINSDTEELTIQDVTEFYLNTDPTSPAFIKSYRRNLLYLPNPRWHLGVVMGVGSGSDRAAIDHYNLVHANHDKIMESLGVEGHTQFDEDGIPLLSRAEIAAIIEEKIEPFYQKELDRVHERVASVRAELNAAKQARKRGGKR